MASAWSSSDADSRLRGSPGKRATCPYCSGMDPQANLEEQLTRAREVLTLADRDESAPRAVLEFAAVELAELVLALDEWRRRGGYDPYRSA